METILTLIGVAILQSPLIIGGTGTPGSGNNRIFIYRRWISVLLMLPIPLAASIQIDMKLSATALLFLLFNANLILAALYWFSKRTNENPKQYIQVNLNDQPSSMHFANALSWIIYLIFYEALVRVILVDELIAEGFSSKQALFMSVLIYAVLHIPQGLRITLGSLPFGVLAAVWILVTGSLLPVIILHTVCALGYDYIIGWNQKSNYYENSADRLFRFPGK